MTRKSLFPLLMVAGLVLLGIFAVMPEAFAASFDHGYFSPNSNDLSDFIGIASGTDYGGGNIAFTVALPLQASFAGSAAMVINHNAPNLATTMGISFWAQSTSTSATQALVSDESMSGCGGSHDQFVIQYNVPNPGNVNVQGDHNCSNYMSLGSSAVNITDGAYHMITVTADGSMISLYIDDLLRATSTLHSWIGESGSGTFHFGTFSNNTSYFKGNALCLVITSSSLIQADVDQLWNSGAPSAECIGNGPDLDHAYFGQNSSDLRDIIGNSTGTQNGATNIFFTNPGNVGNYASYPNATSAMKLPFLIGSSTKVFSESGWFVTTSSLTQFLLDTETGTGCSGTHDQFILQTNVPSIGKTTLQADHGCVGFTSMTTSLTNANDGNFHHFVVTSNGSEIDFYQDDILQATTTYSSWNGATTNDQNIVGSNPQNGQWLIGGARCVTFGSNYLNQLDVNVLWHNGTSLPNCISGTSVVVTPSVSSGTLNQFKGDGATPIGEGSSTDESTVVLTATLQSASVSDSLQMQVEIATSTFSGIPTATSITTVVSGNSATTTVDGLANDSYIWQARVLDITTGATSSWQRFASSSADFIIAMPTSTGYEISDGSVVALYHLSGVADSSGRGRTLTNTGSVSFVTSTILNNGADITTTGQWLTYGSNLGWTSTASPFSVAFWIKPNVELNSGEMTLFHLDSSIAGDYNYVGYQYNGGSRRIYYGFSGGSNTYNIDLATSSHFIVYTRDGSGHRDLYLDGLSVASNTTGATYNTGDDQFGLGSDTGIGTSNAQTDAVFDETVVLNRVMSSTEVTSLYSGGSGMEVCVTAGC